MKHKYFYKGCYNKSKYHIVKEINDEGVELIIYRYYSYRKKSWFWSIETKYLFNYSFKIGLYKHERK